MKETLKAVLEYLPQPVRRSVEALPLLQQDTIQEIRLRCGRPVTVTVSGRDQFLTPEGGLTLRSAESLTASRDDLNRSFQAVVSYSVYSHEQDVAEGYVTIKGGCRVGICGTAVRLGEHLQNVRAVAGLNFRIAGAYPGIAQAVYQQSAGRSVLIAGPVGSGKTTFLRDLARLTGNTRRTAVVDERGELAAVVRGMPQNDVGVLTDVLDGYPRAAGILTALRVLSPACIVCDEISTMQDADAILQAAGCGVQFLASAHAGSLEALQERPVLRPLFEAEVFSDVVLLQAGKVRALRRLTKS
ncbi:MAG: Flp pilus assembly complex ATPase component TadA [Oscillospiraceae bacterium]|nr:Flp pilus assembly complex ATPase component TadA [Oscillospiraceae bacterium]